MRKNGINRTLTPIEGGVCAPEGFLANAVASGIREDGTLDFGMIFTPKRCSVGCVFATGKTVGAPVVVSKKNMRSGYARAILVNGGFANAIDVKGEALALGVCDLFFPYRIERTETVIASTGKIGKPLSLQSFQSGYQSLYEGLDASNERSLRVAKAIQGEGEEVKQLAFSFYLGDYPCKIGVVFKGGRNSSPNMATFLAFITTDVNISTPMLQKALEAEVRETLNLMNLGGRPSPNDTVCILANGRAGNYRIDYPDSEYEKFASALKGVLTEVCLRTAREAGRAFTCRVVGGKSKEVVRLLARKIVGAYSVKADLVNGRVNAENLLFLILSLAELRQKENIQIALRSKCGELALYENGRSFALAQTREFLSIGECEIFVDLREGNFQALAYGAFDEKK